MDQNVHDDVITLSFLKKHAFFFRLRYLSGATAAASSVYINIFTHAVVSGGVYIL